MAIDNTPPRLKLIVTIAAITVVTLIGVNFALVSYFSVMTDAAQREKIAPTTEKDEQKKAEELALTKAAMPLDEAMALIAKGERPEAIAPHPSDDLGPVTGWSKMPRPAPQPHAAATPVGAAAVDAGAASHAADAGAAPAEGPRPAGRAAPHGGAGAAAADAGAGRATH